MPSYRELPSSRVLLGLTCIGLLGASILAMVDRAMAPDSAEESDNAAMHAAMAANLQQSVLVWPDTTPITAPALVSTNGVALTEQLRGKWSLLFFGFTSCTHVCPMTLSTLARLADRPDSGVAGGDSQVLFVTVDPAIDDRDRLAAYLSKFDERFIGYTGSASDLQTFAAEVGAAFAVAGGKIDHSTSVFVLDPQGRSAGVLLRPSDVTRMLSDFNFLKHEALTAGNQLSASDG